MFIRGMIRSPKILVSSLVSSMLFYLTIFSVGSISNNCCVDFPESLKKLAPDGMIMAHIVKYVKYVPSGNLT